MFESSFLLTTKAILINILVPLIPGILFLWIFFGEKFKGILLYILARCVGTGVVAFSLFNLQFIHFGIGIGEYVLIVGILLAVRIVRTYMKKHAFSHYFKTLKIQCSMSEIQQSYKSISLMQKIFVWGGAILGFGVLILSFIRVTNLPTYADDSFGNRNGPAINIYHDGGVKLFGDQTEILGRGRLGYPIYIPIYKAVISDFMGGFDDVYINLWQWILFLSLIVFTVKITRDKTKNIFYSILPVIGICGLPLVFFHAGEGYMELPSAIFSVFTIRGFYEFLEKKDYSDVALGVLLGSILSQIKNDGFVVYLPGILIGFLIMLLMRKNISDFFNGLVKSVKSLRSSVFYVIWFMLPFMLVRMVNHIGLNPMAADQSLTGIAKVTHWEIFSQFKPIFLQMDNYNVVLILICIMLWVMYVQRKNLNKLFVLLPGLVILTIFILAFLLTENYIFVMNMTTVNRVFTMCFVIFLSFGGILLHKENDE